ncbi:MAG: hypothetical protein Q8S58_00495 [Bosea sp. (in: a-proteobacteria)]|uniref:hypothetical protein n=1 Tax=Bosea sp. (in: a-proteobacteria) TaxID=1871050 RepID=UPI0027363346|nr:hypothetical protein [Bosea sp. (in: a-proteobacteria)]MDP3256265.1 hypothetical protein [Bosea sp. (in: a-proteobacteria)]MDP3317580.1 hypothetical protein [Bosea sp. (in: a-proteobacteria)]
MVMTCIAAMIGASSLGVALFGGIVPLGSTVEEVLSVALAATTALAVATASALDT